MAIARGIVSSRAALFIVAVSIVVGAAISLLRSSETISQKRKDELVRKSDDQSCERSAEGENEMRATYN